MFENWCTHVLDVVHRSLGDKFIANYRNFSSHNITSTDQWLVAMLLTYSWMFKVNQRSKFGSKLRKGHSASAVWEIRSLALDLSSILSFASDLALLIWKVLKSYHQKLFEALGPCCRYWQRFQIHLIRTLLIIYGIIVWIFWLMILLVSFNQWNIIKW